MARGEAPNSGKEQGGEVSIASDESMSKALDERGTKSGDEGIGFREVIGHTYNSPSSQRGLKITDFPHLFSHFLLFHFSLPLHLSPTPPTFAHPFHRLLPLFPILLLHTHSLPFANSFVTF